MNRATIAIAAATGLVIGLWIADALATEPDAGITVTATNYCEFVGAFSYAAGLDRDQGVTKRESVATLLADGSHLDDRLQDDLLTAIDLVYLVDLGTPSEVSGLVFDVCQETYGEPL